MRESQRCEISERPYFLYCCLNCCHNSPAPSPPATCPSIDVHFLLTATVADTDVGEAPDVAHPDAATHHGQDVVSLVGPRRSLHLIIVVCSDVTITFFFPDVIRVVLFSDVTTGVLGQLWRAGGLVVSGLSRTDTVRVERSVHVSSLGRQERGQTGQTVIGHSF